jgi:hypothetical protein
MQYSGDFDEDVNRLCRSHGLMRNEGETSHELFARLQGLQTRTARGIPVFVGQKLSSKPHTSYLQRPQIVNRTIDGKVIVAAIIGSKTHTFHYAHHEIDRDFDPAS